MQTPKAIDTLLAEYLNAGGTSDANNALIRRRAWDSMQWAADHLWEASSWPFRSTFTTIALAASDRSVACPSDFSAIGEHGYLAWVNDSAPLTYLKPHELFRLWETHSSGNGKPRFYTIANISSSYYPVIHFDKTNDSARTLRMYYDTKAPILLDAPLAVTAADSGNAGNPNGAYTYKVTFVDLDGNESIGGTTSSSVTVTSKQISLTSVPVGNYNTASRKVYRTAASGSQHKLVGTISDNTTTTYTDNVADGSLGANVPTADSAYNDLNRIPRQYHHRPLLSLAKMHLAQKHGDIRSATEFKAEADSALAEMRSRLVHGLEELGRVGELGISSYGMW